MFNVCYKSDVKIIFWVHENFKSTPANFLGTAYLFRSLTTSLAKQY